MSEDIPNKQSVFSYSNLGYEEIDAQHVLLISIINQISNLTFSRTEEIVIMKLLDDLILFLVKHFSTEEKYMEIIDNDDTKQKHKNAHRLVLENAIVLKHNMEKHILQIQSEFKSSLNLWSKHICSYDSDLVKKINELEK